MKKNVAITDKWVEVGRSKQMLRVYDNMDVLFVTDEFGDFYVHYRYTDASAKNIYESYSYMNYPDGTTGEIRMLMIAGERYEYMYNNSNGFCDYFIGENSRGYWMNTRFNYISDAANNYDGMNFASYMVKDGLGIGAFMDIDNMNDTLDTLWYNAFDPENDRELFQLNKMDGAYDFDLYLSAIKSGLVSVSATEYREDVEPGIFSTDRVDTLKTNKGTYKANIYDESNVDGEFNFRTGNVRYIFGENVYYGALNFRMPNPTVTLNEATLALGDYVSSLGLTLYCDMQTVANSFEHSALMAESFGETFEWNGYNLNSMENVRAAKAVLQSQFDSARADFEAIKDFETANKHQKLGNNVDFADLYTIAFSNNTFSGNTVNLMGVSATVRDVDLFEEGGEYVLTVALSLLDEDGNPKSTNTVVLNGTAPTSVRFNGGEIKLGVTGQYEIPKNLDKGEYALVVYVATKTDGIRVSEMEKVGFVNIEEGEIESSAMHIETDEEDGNLIVEYEIKNTRTITATATKDSYTYSEIKRMINLEILTYGAPYHGAVLEREDGSAVDESSSLGKGTYRMTCYLATDDGLAQSYVYLVLE